MPGPSPQPTALKLLRGNPGKRPLNKNEPKPGEFRAKAPNTLNDDGKKEWKRIVPILKRMRILTEADYLALGNLCWAFQTAAQAQRDLAKAGLLYKTQSGYIQPSPLMSIITQNMGIVNKLLAEFGMVPGSRSRLNAAPQDAPKSKWDEQP